MKKFIIHLILSFLILMSFACSQPQSVISAKLGSSLNSMGEITDSSLNFTSSKVENPQRSKNIFDSVFFDGSIICYSFAMKNSLAAQTILVQLVNPQTEEAIHVDNMKINNKTISGFILVGNVLEFFYQSDLNKRPPENHYADEEIDFIIRLSVSDNSKQMKYDLSGKFSLSYEP